MSYTAQNNTGSLFKNDRKNNEKQPDYTGTVNVDGKELRLAAWVKEGKNGKFFSLKLSEPQEKTSSTPTSSDNDNLPF
jgi:hypothetical protein